MKTSDELLDELYNELPETVREAVKVAADYASEGAAHHLIWVIDQMVRSLTKDKYEQFIEAYEGRRTDGKDTWRSTWDEGIAP